MMFEGGAASNYGGGANARSSADKGWAQDARATMNLCAASDPNARFDLLTFGKNLNTLHEGVDGKIAQVVGRSKTINVSIIEIALPTRAEGAKLMTN
jgi:hypothetical protein